MLGMVSKGFVFVAPSKAAIEFELDGCPYMGWNSSVVVVKWDAHMDQHPGPIDHLFLRIAISEELLAAFLICSGRDPQAAVCDDVSESEWCEWRLEEMDGHCNVTGLSAYTIYQFEIKASNTKGSAELQRETTTCQDGEVCVVCFCPSVWLAGFPVWMSVHLSVMCLPACAQEFLESVNCILYVLIIDSVVNLQ